MNRAVLSKQQWLFHPSSLPTNAQIAGIFYAPVILVFMQLNNLSVVLHNALNSSLLIVIGLSIVIPSLYSFCHYWPESIANESVFVVLVIRVYKLAKEYC